MAACPRKVTLGLFAAYVVSLAAATANPAGLPHERAYTLTQAANVVMLLLLAYCRSSRKLALMAGALGAAFAARATNAWAGGTRWDAFLVTVGALLVLHYALVAAAPAGLRHKTLLSLALSCVIMPALVAVPQLTAMPRADPADLRAAALLCREAYRIREPTADAPGSLGSLGAGSLDAFGAPLWTLYDAATDTHAGVKRVVRADGDTDLFVYFAGSQSKRNWQTDFNVLSDAVPAAWECGAPQTMRTHRGFTEAFNSVAPKVLQTLRAQVNPGTRERIVVCGHSLGGALATMAGLYIACKAPDLRARLSVITFGAPQVGDGPFVQFFDATVPVSVRVFSPLDPVARVLSVQLTHVKGAYPVAAPSLAGVTNPHSMDAYIAAVGQPRAVGVVAGLLPAVAAGVAAGWYAATHAGPG